MTNWEMFWDNKYWHIHQLTAEGGLCGVELYGLTVPYDTMGTVPVCPQCRYIADSEPAPQSDARQLDWQSPASWQVEQTLTLKDDGTFHLETGDFIPVTSTPQPDTPPVPDNPNDELAAYEAHWLTLGDLSHSCELIAEDVASRNEAGLDEAREILLVMAARERRHQQRITALEAAAQSVIDDCEYVGVIPTHLDLLKLALKDEGAR